MSRAYGKERCVSFEGEQCGIPYDHGPLILAYNKNVFNATGGVSDA